MLRPFYLDEGLECTYFRGVDLEGTRWLNNIIIKLDKEKVELKNKVLSLKWQADDMACRREESERIEKNLKRNVR